MPEVRLMQGNEAVAEGALAAGLSFYAGYPISPSSEIAEYLAELLPALGGTFVQMEDEIAGMAAIIGASLAGAKSMTATSGPGFSLMQENLGFAVMAEVPCVVVNVQRVGPSTGVPTAPAQGDVMQARWGTHGDHPAVVLVPATVRECYDLTIEAFNLAEKLRQPVIILLDEFIGHLREPVAIPPPGSYPVINRVLPPAEAAGKENFKPYAPGPGGIPPVPVFGAGYAVHVTGLVHDESGRPATDPVTTESLIRRLHAKIEKVRDCEGSVEIFPAEGAGKAEILVVAYGASARAAKAAVRRARQEGIEAVLFRPRMIWPFPEKTFRQCLEDAGGRLKQVIVAEMNLGQLRLEIERLTAGVCPVKGVHRLGTPVLPADIIETMRG